MAVALLLAPVAVGQDCQLTTSRPEVSAHLPAAGGYYVDVDCDGGQNGGCAVTAVWIYEEANGVDGLQRADEVHDDTCGGQWPSDRVVF